VTEEGAPLLIFDDVVLKQGDFSLSVALSIKQGAVTALMGQSGAGKSTLLAAIAGFLSPDQGQISVDGVKLNQLSPAKRPVSMLFQDNNLFPHLSVLQNVGLGLRGDLRLSAIEAQHVSDVLTDVGLGGMGDRKPAALSGGQQSRAALARVLVGSRSVVLLDEPFAALGPALKAEMLDLVKTRLAGRTIVMVSHDPADAHRIADTVCIVADGCVSAPVETKELFANPPEALSDYLG